MLFPYEIAKKNDLAKKTRFEAPFGARWIWIFFLCQYRGWRKQAKKSAAFRQEKRASWNCGVWCGPTWSALDFQLEPWVPKKLRLGGWAVPKLMSQTPVWDSQLMTLTSLNLNTWKYMNMFLTFFLAQLHTGFAATVETPMASITALPQGDNPKYRLHFLCKWRSPPSATWRFPSLLGPCDLVENTKGWTLWGRNVRYIWHGDMSDHARSAQDVP